MRVDQLLALPNPGTAAGRPLPIRELAPGPSPAGSLDGRDVHVPFTLNSAHPCARGPLFVSRYVATALGRRSPPT